MTSPIAEIAAGAIFERDHPFTMVRENQGDPDFEIERWRPGAWEVWEQNDDDAPTAKANGLGRVKYTVVSTHKPPGYPTRIFFKREFTTPDGGRYSPGRLMNCVASKFRKDVTAFPFPFEVEEL